MDEQLNQHLNDLIMGDKWNEAKDLLLLELKEDKNDHWTLTQLSLVYYELRDYKKALEYSRKAMRVEPECPLVLNDYGRNLYANGKYIEAIKIFETLISRDIDKIAYDDCGEGLKFAKFLVNDSMAMIALCYKMEGEVEKAIEYFKKHLANRRRGTYSNFTKKEIVSYIANLEKEQDPK